MPEHPPKSLFFCDIDGTLLRGAMSVPSKVKTMAAEYRRAGGVIVLCSGRSQWSAARVAHELDVFSPGILYNGAVVYDFASDRALATTPAPAGIIDLFPLVLAAFPELSLQAYTLERVFLLQRNAVLVERGIVEELEPVTTPPAAVTGSVIKLVLTHADPAELRRCGDEFFSGEGYKFAFASRRFAEVVAADADKGAGALRVADMLGVPLSRCFAAGDAGTDLPVMRLCRHSFAPADAAPNVLTDANETVPPCEEGGMAQAFAIAIQMMAEAEFG